MLEDLLKGNMIIPHKRYDELIRNTSKLEMIKDYILYEVWEDERESDIVANICWILGCDRPGRID